MNENETKPNDQHPAWFAAALRSYMEETGMDTRALAQRLVDMFAKSGETKTIDAIRRQVDYAKTGKKGGKNEGVGRKYGQKIAEVFGCNYGDFLIRGQILIESENPSEADARWRSYLERVSILREEEPPILKTEPAPEYIPVPTAATALSAGQGNLVYQDELTSVKNYFHAGWLFGKCLGGAKYAVIFRVDGDSMSPTIEHGSEVLVDTTPIDSDEWIPNKIYAIRQENEVRIKRLLRSKQSDKIIVSSDNRDIDENTGGRRYEDSYESIRDICIIGRVIWHSGEL